MNSVLHLLRLTVLKKLPSIDWMGIPTRRRQSLKATVLLLVGVLMAGSSATSHAEVADGYLRRWVDKRVRQMNARFVRGRYEKIGWADGIGPALKVAQQHQRPVFLFTLDGHMNSGRC